MWEDVIIPAFEESHPGIEVEFEATPNQAYAPALTTKLEGGTAADVFACEPFDTSLALWDAGFLPDLSGMPELERVTDVAKAAWSTDEGTPYCLPASSVMHGFTYNKTVFDELGLTPPETVDEFFDVLDAIKQAGYTPLSYGTGDAWITTVTGLSNVGPNFWDGENGRQAVIDGSQVLTDPEYVAAWQFMQDWIPYLPDGYQSVKYTDTQELFYQGEAIIMPAGSWEIRGFEDRADFEVGIFQPPVQNEGDPRWINDFIDTAYTYNPESDHVEEAKELLAWLGGEEAAVLNANAFPGFLPLSDYDVELENPIAQEYLSWRETAQPTIRLWAQYLSRGTPSLSDIATDVTTKVLNGDITAEEAAEQAQTQLESWYEPRQ
ncbi:ABC transporter substrate-binding protein [Microbacterium thalassium]|uniref:ABC transporter substrate-binding protein n=1 Tax=Microbacterium TaxID=33882 RepID=UPI00146BCD01|nr:ABC transporter substrate-binding protein [Microbacterium thalassium]